MRFAARAFVDRVASGTDGPLRTACTALVLVVSGVFLLANLGTYALWDDEAETALLARGVLQTGDTTALIGHNINARRGGINLRGLAERLTPPLPTYLMAASFALGGETAFWARLPFALCGLAAVGIMLAVLWRAGATNWHFLVFAIALLANAPFFLYCRNARYYGAVLLVAIAAGVLALQGLGSVRRRVAFAVLGGLLLSCHPIAFMQVAAVAAVDWLVFRPRAIPTAAQVASLVVPFLVVAAPTLLVWNPLFVKSSAAYLGQMTILDRLTLLWWNARDLFAAEFIPLAALAYVPVAFYRTRDPWLLRSCLAVGVVVLVTTATSYQSVAVTSVADVRYMIVAIPLGLAATVRSFAAVPVAYRATAAVAAVLACATNIGSGKFDWQRGPESTAARFATELARPIAEPYTPVAAWLRAHAAPRASVLVVPEFMMYPLMFHAPDQVYAWQIPAEADPQFQGLDAIHYQGRVPPDYVVAFGPVRQAIEKALDDWRAAGVRYERVADLPVFWQDTYRPEVFWRKFTMVSGFDPSVDGIFIYRRLRD